MPPLFVTLVVSRLIPLDATAGIVVRREELKYACLTHQ